MADAVVQVVDAPERQRYEALVDGAVAGFADYVMSGSVRVFTHTEVDPAYEGQGVGGALAKGALDDVRRQRTEVLPLCPFIKAWIGRHPDYADLVHSPPPSQVTD